MCHRLVWKLNVQCRELFGSLDKVEAILSKSRYIAGDRLTEADVRLFMTLIRFDEVCRLDCMTMLPVRGPAAIACATAEALMGRCVCRVFLQVESVVALSST